MSNEPSNETNVPVKGKNAQQNAPEKKMSNMQKIRLVLSTVLAIFLIIFIVQNSNKVEVEFLNMTKRVPIVIIMLISLLIGSLITYLLMKYRSAKKKRK